MSAPACKELGGRCSCCAEPCRLPGRGEGLYRTGGGYVEGPPVPETANFFGYRLTNYCSSQPPASYGRFENGEQNLTTGRMLYADSTYAIGQPRRLR